MDSFAEFPDFIGVIQVNVDVRLIDEFPRLIWFYPDMIGFVHNMVFGFADKANRGFRGCQAGGRILNLQRTALRIEAFFSMPNSFAIDSSPSTVSK